MQIGQDSQMSLFSQLFVELIRMMDNNVIIEFSKAIPLSDILNQINNTADETIYEYIKSLVKQLIRFELPNDNRFKRNFEEQVKENLDNNYEGMIQKLENTIRQHIRVEQQQRLHIDCLTEKIEELIYEQKSELQIYQDKINLLQKQVQNNQKEYLSIHKVQNLNQTNIVIEDKINKQFELNFKKKPCIASQNIDSHMKALFRIYNNDTTSKKSIKKKESNVLKTDEDIPTIRNINSQLFATERNREDSAKRSRNYHQSLKQEANISQREVNNHSADRQLKCKYPKTGVYNVRQSLIQEQNDVEMIKSCSFDCVKKIRGQKRQLNPSSQSLFKFLQKK